MRACAEQAAQHLEKEEEADIYGGAGRQPDQEPDGGDDIYGGVGGPAPDQDAAGYDEAEEEDLYNDIVPGLAQVDGVSDA